MTFRGVLFDIGNVLTRATPTLWQARWEARLGLAPGAVDERLAPVYAAGTLGALAASEVVARVNELLGTDRGADIVDDLWSEYLGEANEPLLAFFASLRPRYRTGLLSNSWVGAREREQARYGYASLCDVIVYSHEEGIAKPDPRIYEIAVARLGVTATEVVFVDDLRANVEAARRLGMTTVHVTDTAEALSAARQLLDGRGSLA